MSAKTEHKKMSLALGAVLILLCQLDGIFVNSEKFRDCSNHHKASSQGHLQRHSKHAHYEDIPILREFTPTTLAYDDNDTMGIDIKLMQHIYGRHKRKYYELNHSHELPPWPVKKEAVMEGDLILGGLMMVHEREDNITCGPIMPQGGVQALECMLYTIDKINEMKLLKNFTIGAHILDDCDKDSYGLEMAVDFIKGDILYDIHKGWCTWMGMLRCSLHRNSLNLTWIATAAEVTVAAGCELKSTCMAKVSTSFCFTATCFSFDLIYMFNQKLKIQLRVTERKRKKSLAKFQRKCLPQKYYGKFLINFETFSRQKHEI